MVNSGYKKQMGPDLKLWRWVWIFTNIMKILIEDFQYFWISVIIAWDSTIGGGDTLKYNFWNEILPESMHPSTANWSNTLLSWHQAGTGTFEDIEYLDLDSPFWKYQQNCDILKQLFSTALILPVVSVHVDMHIMHFCIKFSHSSTKSSTPTSKDLAFDRCFLLFLNPSGPETPF